MDLNQKEELYLKAKEAYYKGEQIMSDFEFDSLEEELKAENSHVIEIVDGDETEGERFKHLNPMLSLEKIQVKEDDLKLDEILKFIHRTNSNGYECSPKLDGSAMSLIYKDGKLIQALTRGNEKGGLDRTNKMKQIVPTTINLPGTVEIRGEVVIEAALYFKKYVDPTNPKNPRNYVAGVIAREEDSPRYNPDAVKDMDFIAYHILANPENKKESYHVRDTMKVLEENGFNVKYTLLIRNFSKVGEFEKIYKEFKEYREKNSEYQLDGIVIKAKEDLRKGLGENNHHPKWAIAIKFPPKEAKTTIRDIVWQLGSSGKVTPIAIMDPVDLDGSQVTRALLHNLGNVKSQKAYTGAEVIIAKKGDIIPQIIKVTKPSQNLTFDFPKDCPVCKDKLTVVSGKVKGSTEHLMCLNDFCSGQAIKKLERGIKALRIDNLGLATVELIYEAGIKSIIDLFNPDKYNETELIKSGLFKKGRSLEIILEEVNKITELKIDQVVDSLCFQDSGKTVSREIGKFLSKASYDFKGLNKSIIGKLTNSNSPQSISVNGLIKAMEARGIKIVLFKDEEIDPNAKSVEFTGSPKPHFDTKEDFLNQIKAKGFLHDKLTAKSTYLVTDSYSSSSSKMDKAKKLGVEIITYEDLFVKLKDLQPC